MLLVALIQLLVFITGGQSRTTDAAVFYSVGYYDCLAVEEQHQLRVGSERIVLAPAQKPLHVTVDAMVPWREPSTERRPRGDCTGGYKSNLEDEKSARVKVTQFAHVSGLPDHYEVVFAVPPSGAIILGGAPIALGAQERRRLVNGVRSALPRSWRVDRTLIRAYRYGPASGHAIDEL